MSLVNRFTLTKQSDLSVTQIIDSLINSSVSRQVARAGLTVVGA